MRFFALCLLFAFPSFAQQSTADGPASKEDIQRYLNMVHMRDRMNDMRDAETKSIHRVVHELVEKQPDLPPSFEPRMHQMVDDMLDDVSVDKMMKAVEPVYEKHLTKGEMDALFAFYSTPMGQKILKELPGITSDATKAAAGLMQNMASTMIDRLQNEIEEMEKEQRGGFVKPKPSTQN